MQLATRLIGVPAMYNFMLACGMKDYDLSRPHSSVARFSAGTD